MVNLVKIPRGRLLELITKEICKLDGRVVVSVDGYYGVGKSRFADELRKNLELLDQTAVVLSTDQFMRFSRKDRTIDYSRYTNHYNWYDLDKVLRAIDFLLQSRPSIIRFEQLYNHKTGELDDFVEITVTERMITILEGMYATHSYLSGKVNFSVLLVSDHDTLLDRVLTRDHIERGLEETYIRERYSIINGNHFEVYVREQMQNVELVIDNTSLTTCTILHGKELGNNIINATKLTE
ncbi:MAG: hypothetical protein K8L97_31290 [Anaerolineae bacterium]|nr:hypothetical protein [Anaerolineae bacterium]